MNTNCHNQASSSRAARTTIPALLVVGLLIGVTISAIKPGVRALHRDAAAELLATRQIAKTIVRAVRGLSSQVVRIPIKSRVDLATGPAPAASGKGQPFAGLPMGYSMPRFSLLALPPPTA